MPVSLKCLNQFVTISGILQRRFVVATISYLNIRIFPRLSIRMAATIFQTNPSTSTHLDRVRMYKPITVRCWAGICVSTKGLMPLPIGDTLRSKPFLLLSRLTKDAYSRRPPNAPLSLFLYNHTSR